MTGASVGAGLPTGSAFSIRLGAGVGFSVAADFFVAPGFLLVPGFFFAPGFFFPADLGVGLFLAPGFFFGVGDAGASAFLVCFGFGLVAASSSLDFFVPDFGVGDLSGSGFGASSSSLSVAGDLSGSGVGLFFAAGVAVGFGVGEDGFLLFALRSAGFGFAFSGVSAGVEEAAGRVSSRASRFFFASSVNCALTKVQTIALSASAMPKKTRGRITAGERNRA